MTGVLFAVAACAGADDAVPGADPQAREDTGAKTPLADAGRADTDADAANIGFANDGDAFTLTHEPSPAATEYRLYSLRNAVDPARIMVDQSFDGRPLRDPYVYDGVHVYYRLFAVVAGKEQLLMSADGVQPARQWQAPLRIETAGTYTGNWRSTDPSQPAVVIASGVKGVVLEGSRIASMGDGIQIQAGSGAEVRATRGWGLHPGVANSSHGKFVAGAEAESVVVEHTYSENWLFGVYVDGQLKAAQKVVRVRYNRMRNVQGRVTNADGTYQLKRSTSGGVAHAIQLNGVSSCPDTELAYNEISQEPSIGFSEDVVNVYQSSGTAEHPQRVHDNVVYGGYGIEPGKPPSQDGVGGGAYAGCGIISDGADPRGDEKLNGFTEIDRNIVIATTNCGIGIAAGSFVNVHDNRMISAGVLEDGTALYAANVGGYVWNQYSSAMHANSMTRNYSGWMQMVGVPQNQGSAPKNNPYWTPDGETNGSRVGENVTAPEPLDLQTERGEYQLFWQRTREQSIRVGVQ